MERKNSPPKKDFSKKRSFEDISDEIQQTKLDEAICYKWLCENPKTILYHESGSLNEERASNKKGDIRLWIRLRFGKATKEDNKACFKFYVKLDENGYNALTKETLGEEHANRLAPIYINVGISYSETPRMYNTLIFKIEKAETDDHFHIIKSYEENTLQKKQKLVESSEDVIEILPEPKKQDLQDILKNNAVKNYIHEKAQEYALLSKEVQVAAAQIYKEQHEAEIKKKLEEQINFTESEKRELNKRAAAKYITEQVALIEQHIYSDVENPDFDKLAHVLMTRVPQYYIRKYHIDENVIGAIRLNMKLRGEISDKNDAIGELEREVRGYMEKRKEVSKIIAEHKK